MRPTWARLMRLRKYSPGMIYFWRDGGDYLLLGGQARLFADVLEHEIEKIDLEDRLKVDALRVSPNDLSIIISEGKRRNFGLVVQVVEDE